MEKITRYPSIAALGRDAATLATYNPSVTASRAYAGGETIADSLRMAESGDTRLVPEAERLLAQLDSAIDMPDRELISDMAGAYASVPDYLAGMPDCMRRRAPVETELAPVAIYTCLTCSFGLAANIVMRRGVAVLALTMALARVRPVALHAFNIGRNRYSESVIVSPINTTPLDLATACYALTSAGFVRGLCYSLAQQRDFAGETDIAWPKAYGTDSYFPELLARLGGDPAVDMILPAAHISDPAVREPVAWVNAQLARFRECRA